MADTGTETPVTLTAFIKDNQPVITVIGVFTALTVFSQNIGSGRGAAFLAASFLTVSLLLWIELASVFPENRTWRLSVFGSIMLYCAVYALFYWLILVEQTGVLPWLILFPIAFGLERLVYALWGSSWLQEPAQKYPKRARFIYGVVVCLVLLVAVIISALIGVPLETFVGDMRREFGLVSPDTLRVRR